MFDPIVNFFTRVFQSIGRGIGFGVGVVLMPFMWARRWYANRGWILTTMVGAIGVLILGLYGYFIWNTQRWLNFNPDYVGAYDLTAQRGSTSPQAAPEKGIISAPQGAASAAQSCRRSFIVDITADLIDFNVNQNEWISSMILYKLGLFGMDWDDTPFFDNKASFQRGVNQAVRRTAIELVDSLGRVRGTSLVDSNLQLARAHARTGDAVAISAYIGKGARFADAIGEFGRRYAEQNERDHFALVDAIKRGRVESQTGW